ncbi:hypothetical protein Tco_0961399 [Tanacetum coccineum]
MFIKFVIQNQFFSYSLEEFAQILYIPYEGACVFTDKWSLDELAYGVPMDDPYQTNPPSPDDIISYIRIDLEGQVRCIRYEEEIDVHEHQILTHEIVPTLKPLEEIIQENVFYLGGNRDHVPTCLCYMFYCVANSENESSELSNESYVLYDRVMNPLTVHQERNTRKDRGMRIGHHSTSSSSAFDQPSSSHLNNDNDRNGEGTLRASTPSPINCVNSLTNNVLQIFQNPPNIDPHMEPFYTRQIEIINRQVQIQGEHRGGLRSIRKGLRNLWKNMKNFFDYLHDKLLEDVLNSILGIILEMQLCRSSQLVFCNI